MSPRRQSDPTTAVAFIVVYLGVLAVAAIVVAILLIKGVI